VLCPLRFEIDPDWIVIRPTNELQHKTPDHLDEPVGPFYDLTFHGDGVVYYEITKGLQTLLHKIC
jgi:hypothetical protein